MRKTTPTMVMSGAGVAVVPMRRRIITKYNTVPYARVNRKPVHTCSVDERALGFVNLIDGWGNSYYVPGSHRPGTMKQKYDAIVAALAKIDWKRVVLVKDSFRIRMGGATMVFTSTLVHFVTEQRYTRLLRHCMKSVPEVKFNKEFDVALKMAPKKSNVSGSLGSR